MGRSVSGLASLSFSHAFTLKLFECETNLPTIGLLPLSVQFNRCWHVGGYSWVCEICFPCLLLTPHWRHSLCMHLGMKVQLSVVLCLYCPALQFLCTYSLSAVFEMLTLYERKRKCLKKNPNNQTKTQTTKKSPRNQNPKSMPHKICICIYTCPYNYT